MKNIFLGLLLGLSGAARAFVVDNSAISPRDPIPDKILSCGASIITEIGGRLEGDKDFSSGTGVTFANGLAQSSYDKVDAIVHSKIGQHVMICYVWHPKVCPPGDDRGKTYTVTNLTTLESWTLADSEHLCGGA